MKRNYKRRIDDLLDLPKEVVTNEPKLTILGFEQIIIENFKSILEYEDYYVRVNTYIGVININGIGLKLIQMTEDDIMITGKFDSIDFESVINEEKEVK